MCARSLTCCRVRPCSVRSSRRRRRTRAIDRLVVVVCLHGKNVASIAAPKSSVLLMGHPDRLHRTASQPSATATSGATSSGRPSRASGRGSQSLAVIWLVLELTDRSDQLGIATALQFLPMLLLGAPAGRARRPGRQPAPAGRDIGCVGRAGAGVRRRRCHRPRHDLVDLRPDDGARPRPRRRAAGDAGHPVPTRRTRPAARARWRRTARSTRCHASSARRSPAR